MLLQFGICFILVALCSDLGILQTPLTDAKEYDKTGKEGAADIIIKEAEDVYSEVDSFSIGPSVSEAKVPLSFGQPERHFSRRRKRRSLRFMKAGARLLKGIFATRKLLIGARKMFSTKSYTQYEKKGGSTMANLDFFSVGPTNVKDYGVQRTGQVGDRKIILTLGISDNPTLSIYKPKILPNKAVDQLIDNILYKD